MAKKTRAVVKKHDPVDEFLITQCLAEEGAMEVFRTAVRQQMPSVVEKAIASVAGNAFADGVEWALNTPMTNAQRKLIA